MTKSKAFNFIEGISGIKVEKTPKKSPPAVKPLLKSSDSREKNTQADKDCSLGYN